VSRTNVPPLLVVTDSTTLSAAGVVPLIMFGLFGI
jgi:hypothetical protein